MKRSAAAIAVISALVLPLGAHAGPFSDFEAQLRQAYGQYRAALVQTSQGNAEATQKAIGQLSSQWSALEDNWMATPPPQYVDDAQFADTIKSVELIINDATAIVQSGDLAAAHETLEAIRAELGDLHIRNMLYTFTDRVNAYHSEMEGVLSTDFAALGDGALPTLTKKAAVLEYLAGQIAANPAPEANDPAYGPLVKGLTDSVAAITGSLDAGDLEAAIQAAGALKAPFAKLFAKFG